MQRQKNTPDTIQETIELAFAKIYQREIAIITCGRTDKGVHARQFYFHLDLEENDLERLKYRLNRMLPSDIMTRSIKTVDDKFHARFSASSRTYQYFFHRHKDPFLQGLSTWIEPELDMEAIRSGLKLLGNYEDFRSFCKTPDRHNTTICTIHDFSLKTDLGNERFMIEIKANRFLKSMMRILACRLIELGSGSISLHAFEDLLKKPRSIDNLQAMGPDGLYLHKLEY